jgi:hypothetical protein
MFPRSVCEPVGSDGHLADVHEPRAREVERRQRHRRRSVCGPPRLCLGGRRLAHAPREGAHPELDEPPVQRPKLRVGHRAAQPHVRRPAVLRQHVDVRERRLKRLRDEPPNDGDVVGRLVEHHHVFVRDLRVGELRRREKPQATDGRPQRQRLVVRARVDVVRRRDADRGLKRVRLGRDRVGRRVKRERRPEVRVRLHRVEERRHHRRGHRVVRCDLERPHVRLLVVRHRAEDEPPVRREILGRVELRERRNHRHPVARQPHRREAVVDLKTCAVLKVQRARGRVVHDLDRASAGQRRVERRGCQRFEVRLALDRAQRVGRHRRVGDRARALGHGDRGTRDARRARAAARAQRGGDRERS